MNVLGTRSNAAETSRTTALGARPPGDRLPGRNLCRLKWALPIAALAVVAAGIYSLLRTPDWYTLPRIAPQERQAVRDNLVAAEGAFTEALRHSDATFSYQLYQDDVNRWIAMRREIYPLIDELAPPELIDPIVLFEQGEITLAGRYRKWGVSIVASIDLTASFADGEIVLRVARIRCGSMTVPLSFVSLGLRRPILQSAGGVWPGSPVMQGDLASGLHISANGWWKNGGINYRVRDLAVEPGALKLAVEPLGHQSSKAMKRQR